MAQVLDKLIGVLWRLLLGGPDSGCSPDRELCRTRRHGMENWCDSVQPARDERKLPKAVEERLSMATHQRQPSRQGYPHEGVVESMASWMHLRRVGGTAGSRSCCHASDSRTGI